MLEKISRRHVLSASLAVVVLGVLVSLAAYFTGRERSATAAPASARPTTTTERDADLEVDAAVTTAAPPTPRDEVCNGLDDDLDATFDEGCGCARRFAFERPQIWNPGVRDMRVAADGTILAFGERGTLLRYDGRAWRSLTHARDVYVGALPSADGSLVLVRDHGLLRFDGRRLAPFVDTATGRRAAAERAEGDFETGIVLEARGIARRTETGWLLTPTTTTPRAAHVFQADAAIVVGDAGLVMVLDAGAFRVLPFPTRDGLVGVWGVAMNDLYAVGGTKVFHFDGSAWQTVHDDSARTMTDVTGTGARDVRVVASSSDEGFILTFDGARWTPSAPWASSLVRAFAAGAKTYATTVSGDVMRLEPASDTWTNDVPWSGFPMTDAAGTGTDMLFVGGSGQVVHYDGRVHTPVPVMSTETMHFTSVSSAGAGQFVVGGSSTPLDVLTGTGFVVGCTFEECTLREALPSPVRDVWASPSGVVFAVGDQGLLAELRPGQPPRFHPAAHLRYTGVLGFAEDDVYVTFTTNLPGTPASGGVIHWDGTAFTERYRTTTGYVTGISGASRDDFYIAGGSDVRGEFDTSFVSHWDGIRFTPVFQASDVPLVRALWATNTGTVYFAHGGTTVLSALKKWDGTRVSLVATDDELEAHGLFGTAENNYFMLGEHGFIRHRCGEPPAPRVAPDGGVASARGTAQAAPSLPPTALRAVVLVGAPRDRFWEAYGLAATPGTLVPLDVRVDPNPDYESDAAGNQFVRLSPDGRHVAYFHRGRLHVRDVVRGEDRVLPGDPRGHGEIRVLGFSADSKALLYFVVTLPDENVPGGVHRAYVLENGETHDLRLDPYGSAPVLEDATHRLGFVDGALVRLGPSGTASRERPASYAGAITFGATSVANGELTRGEGSNVFVSDLRGTGVQRAMSTTGAGWWFTPTFSPSNAKILATSNDGSVEVFRRDSGHRATVHRCSVPRCRTAFLDEARVVIVDGTRLSLATLDGANTLLRERVVGIGFAGEQ